MGISPLSALLICFSFLLPSACSTMSGLGEDLGKGAAIVVEGMERIKESVEDSYQREMKNNEKEVE